MNPSKSARTFLNQYWYINRMKAAGYPLKDGGHCFGMTYMAMQAFLVDEEMTAFNDRLRTIESIPISDFENHFANLKGKQDALLQAGKTEAAKTLNQTIVDIEAFFDGIALYQSTSNYPHLFEEPTKEQDAAKTMAITRPVSLDSKENAPICIHCDSGAYNEDELAAYLTLLEKELGKTAFALTLLSASHAINLNYSAQHQCWLLVDPNHLPAVRYTDSQLLARALMSGYKQKKGLVMETSLYTTEKHAKKLEENFSSMQATTAWKSLHDASKLETVYEDNFSQVQYALKRKDIAWIQRNSSNLTLTEEMLQKTCIRGDIDVINTLIAHGVKPTEDMLAIACLDGNINTINALMKHGVEASQLVLAAACKGGHIDVIDTLILNDIPPYMILFVACSDGMNNIVQALIKKGLEPNQIMLGVACRNGHIDVVNTLIAHGVEPTEKMREKATQNNHPRVVQRLSEKLTAMQAPEAPVPEDTNDFNFHDFKANFEMQTQPIVHQDEDDLMGFEATEVTELRRAIAGFCDQLEDYQGYRLGATQDELDSLARNTTHSIKVFQAIFDKAKPVLKAPSNDAEQKLYLALNTAAQKLCLQQEKMLEAIKHTPPAADSKGLDV